MQELQLQIPSVIVNTKFHDFGTVTRSDNGEAAEARALTDPQQGL
jgi:hypothetical protein